jgi:CheY-like chemotaxis protein
MKLSPINICFVVEDDKDDQEIFCLAMEIASPSVKCIFANDGEHAINMLKDPQFQPDHIFIDMNMPRMNGFECLKQIKKIPRLSSTPLFVYSTSADPLVVTDVLKLGATQYIVKPTSLDQLVAIIKPIIE